MCFFYVLYINLFLCFDEMHHRLRRANSIPTADFISASANFRLILGDSQILLFPPVTPLSSFFIIIICEDEVSEICFTSRLLAVKPAAGIYYPSFTLRQVLSLALRIRKAGLKQTRGAGK